MRHVNMGAACYDNDDVDADLKKELRSPPLTKRPRLMPRDRSLPGLLMTSMHSVTPYSSEYSVFLIYITG